MSKNICTIIAKNYISFARTLCSSFLEYHPDGKCFVLIIDEFESYIEPSDENFTIVKPEHLNIPMLREFCYKYNITELATAFKPYLVDYLLKSHGLKNILYLDPDILVTNSLDGLYQELNNNDIVLTPHLDRDYPDDGKLPDDGHIMRSGIYNLGFIGLRECENVSNFLNWWQHKLYDKCIIDPLAGYFVDQKFIDLASVLFPNIKVIYDTGYNVAYWNIHSRRVQKIGQAWLSNNGLLYFFHFSNYKPERPEAMSAHQNRFNLKDMPDLYSLFCKYTSLLREHGYDSASKWPYEYKYYSDGEVVDDSDRIFFRKAIPGGLLVNPFNQRRRIRYLKRLSSLMWLVQKIKQKLKSFCLKLRVYKQ